MSDNITERERLAEQVYRRYVEKAYLVSVNYSDELIDDLFLYIDICNEGHDLKECINETC